MPTLFRTVARPRRRRRQFLPSLRPAYTTAQAGDWSSTSTWTLGIVPGNGDRATINHAVTLSDSRTIGNSPAAGNVVLTIGSAGGLTIQSGGTLVLRGDMENRAVVTFNGGSTLTFDSSASGSPTTTAYKTRCSNAVGAGVARFVTSGTASGSHATINSVTTGGALPGYMTSDASRGYFDLSYVDFTDVGNATNAAVTADAGNVANTLQIDHCAFTRCGQLVVTSVGTSSTATVDFCSWTASAGSSCMNVAAATAKTAGTRQITYCSFDITAVPNGSAQQQDFTLDHLVCPAGYGLSTASTTANPASINAVFVANVTSSGTLVFTPTADSTNVYAFCQPNATTTNPHPINLPVNRGITCDGWIIEVGDQITTTDGDLFLAPSPSSARSYTVKNSLALPKGGDLTKHAGQFCSMLGNANYGVSLLHNTYVTSASTSEDGAVSYGETYPGYPGMISAFKSNLAVGLAAGTGQLLVRRGTGFTADAVSAANCDYNGVCNPVTSGTGYVGVAGFYDYVQGGTTQLYPAGGVPTSGAFTLDVKKFDGTGSGTTSSLAFNASGTTIATALSAALTAAGETGHTVTATGYTGAFNGATVSVPNAFNITKGATVYPLGYITLTPASNTLNNSAVPTPSAAMFSTTTGLNSHGVTGNPNFVDNTRNLATWAVSRGSSSSTYAAKCTDAISYLAADPSLIDNLLSHVRGGWAPTNTAFKNAGHDGVTIGAVEGVFGYTLTGSVGTFTETGDAAGLFYGRSLGSAVGVFAETGNAASLLAARLLSASTGPYVFTGNAATLTAAGARGAGPTAFTVEAVGGFVTGADRVTDTGGGGVVGAELAGV